MILRFLYLFMEWTTHNRVVKFTIINFFFFFSISSPFTTISSTTTTASTSCPDGRCPLPAKASTYSQEVGKHSDYNMNIVWKMNNAREMGIPMSLARRYLSGPGSSPPRCTSKCGSCTPCKPVHVPVPPGTPVTAEYYPEAWRCKCGNKLYMP